MPLRVPEPPLSLAFILLLWEDGKPSDLNTLVPADTTLYLQTACSINAEGQVIGIAVVKGSTTDFHAYLLTPEFQDRDSDGE